MMNSYLLLASLLAIFYITSSTAEEIANAETMQKSSSESGSSEESWEEFCEKVICPHFNPPSCKCPNVDLPQWNRKKRSLEDARNLRRFSKVLHKVSSDYIKEMLDVE